MLLDLQHGYAKVLRESMLGPVLMYVSETLVIRKEDISADRYPQRHFECKENYSKSRGWGVM